MRLESAVAVIADHMGAAKKGLGVLNLTWDEGPNAGFSTADLVSRLEEASKKAGVVARQEGDGAAATSAATNTIEAVYQLPLLAHAPMEPMNCTAHVRADSCEVWVGTQAITRARAAAQRRAACLPKR